MRNQEIPMTRKRSAGLRGALSLAASLCFAGTALAGIHTWNVNEVFSNVDGTIQFVELWEAAGGSGEVNIGNNGSLSSTTQNFSFGQSQVVGPTTNKYYLAATAGFAALPGAPTPDVIIPAGSVPFFDTAGDTVDFGVWDSWTFGTVPTNGTDSLDRISGVGANTPTNYAGETATVNAAPAPSVPSMSHPMLWLMAALIGASSLTLLLRKRVVA